MLNEVFEAEDGKLKQVTTIVKLHDYRALEANVIQAQRMVDAANLELIRRTTLRDEAIKLGLNIPKPAPVVEPIPAEEAAPE